MKRLEDPIDLVRTSAVSRSWRQYVISNSLFKKLCLKMFPKTSSFAPVMDYPCGISSPVEGTHSKEDTVKFRLSKANEISEIEKLSKETLSFWFKAFSEDTSKRFENFGFIQFKQGGEYHGNNPEMCGKRVKLLIRFTSSIWLTAIFRERGDFRIHELRESVILRVKSGFDVLMAAAMGAGERFPEASWS